MLSMILLASLLRGTCSYVTRPASALTFFLSFKGDFWLVLPDVSRYKRWRLFFSHHAMPTSSNLNTSTWLSMKEMYILKVTCT